MESVYKQIEVGIYKVCLCPERYKQKEQKKRVMWGIIEYPQKKREEMWEKQYWKRVGIKREEMKIWARAKYGK